MAEADPSATATQCRAALRSTCHRVGHRFTPRHSRLSSTPCAEVRMSVHGSFFMSAHIRVLERRRREGFHCATQLAATFLGERSRAFRASSSQSSKQASRPMKQTEQRFVALLRFFSTS